MTENVSTATVEDEVTLPDDGPAERASSNRPEAASQVGAVDGDDGGAPKERGSGVARLEEEGDVAADYLEELLDILDLDGDIDIDVENGRASVSILAEADATRDLRRLVGQEGEVLDALQELTRLAVQAKTGERTRLMLDILGHRAGHRRTLEAMAETLVAKVRESGESESLDPMTPFERKVVHDVVAAAGLRSESEGEGDGRFVVIHAE